MHATRFFIAAALLMSGTAAAAQSASDAQCFILSNLFAAQSKDAQQQKAAEASLYFYLGRIGSNATATQVKTLFDAQAKTITETNAATLMNGCIKTLQGRMQLIQSLNPPAPATDTKPQQQPPGR